MQIPNNYKDIKLNNQSEYINFFLNLKTTPLTQIQQKDLTDLWKLINTKINPSKLKEYCKSIGYYQFIQTPYWKIVSKYVQQHYNYTCQVCGKRGKELAIHHRTYKNNGAEHLYWETDLICFCRKCHEKIHDEANEQINKSILENEIKIVIKNRTKKPIKLTCILTQDEMQRLKFRAKYQNTLKDTITNALKRFVNHQNRQKEYHNPYKDEGSVIIHTNKEVLSDFKAVVATQKNVTTDKYIENLMLKEINRVWCTV